jgi:hypothetical protein
VTDSGELSRWGYFVCPFNAFCSYDGRPESAAPRRGAVGQLLDHIFGGNRYANCVPVTVVIPANAQVSSIQLQAVNGT